MAPTLNRKSGKILDRSQVKQMVRGAISQVQELKRYDFAIATDDDYATAGTVYGLTTPIVQGDDIVQRAGDVIFLKKIRMALTTRNEGAAGVQLVARILLVCDTMNNGAVPAVTDVLTSSSVLSGYNILNAQKNRFKIYYDQTFDQVGLVDSAVITRERHFEINKKIFFNGATNVAASNGKNAFFVIAIGSAASANALEYSFFHTLIFTDS